MTILPVSMIPLVGRAASSGGFAIAVLIGLALYVAANAKQSQPPTPPY